MRFADVWPSSTKTGLLQHYSKRTGLLQNSSKVGWVPEKKREEENRGSDLLIAQDSKHAVASNYKLLVLSNG